MALTEWNIDGDDSVGITDLLGLLGSGADVPIRRLCVPPISTETGPWGSPTCSRSWRAGLRDSGFRAVENTEYSTDF